MVVLPSGVAMFQGMGEHMAKECNVSCDRVFASITVIAVVGLGAKLAQAAGRCQIAHRLDTAKLLHVPFICVVCT